MLPSASSGTPSAVNSYFSPKLAEQRHGARGPVPEPEVLPHHHGGRVQPVHEHGPDKLIRPEPGELQGERQHPDGARRRARQAARYGGAACTGGADAILA